MTYKEVGYPFYMLRMKRERFILEKIYTKYI